MPTGLVSADAQDDFLRTRRHRALSLLARRLRRQPTDADLILPFEEVVAALGHSGERHLGVQPIPLDSIVGTVDRADDFDRRFRPTSTRVRSRWEGIARAMRRGEALPPIAVYRIGSLHFVRDGHHRVSVGRALGRGDIDADVVEVRTRISPGTDLRVHDLPLKGHERLFSERVPLEPGQRERIRLSDAWHYGDLAEMVEAWGFRAMQERGVFMDRATTAQQWFEREYIPVVEMIDEADLRGDRSETEAYLRVSAERYRLLRTHAWDEEVVARLRHARP